MADLLLARAQLITFVLFDDAGAEVTGLEDAFTVQISKDGGAFAAGAGEKAETGLGWYSYELTAGETDTTGPLSVVITAAGAEQQNLLYQVVGTAWEPDTGPHVLTAAEGAAVLRSVEDDPNLLMLLPGVDAYLLQATGRDWAANEPVREEAKNAARMLMVRWHSDPGGMAAGSALGFGLAAVLFQLKALALELAEEEESA